MSELNGTWSSFNFRSIFNEVSAVLAGKDSDASLIYVGRASFKGDVVPGKLIPSKNIFYIPYNCREEGLQDCEVLQNDSYTWISSSRGVIPQNAVCGGRTSSRERLYVGRAPHFDSLTPGKIHPSHKCLYISYGGKEVAKQDYEILVKTERQAEVVATTSLQTASRVEATAPSPDTASTVNSDIGWRVSMQTPISSQQQPAEIHLNECKICFAGKIGVTFIPCGHCTCMTCAANLSECHLCRQRIERLQRIFCD